MTPPDLIACLAIISTESNWKRITAKELHEDGLDFFDDEELGKELFDYHVDDSTQFVLVKEMTMGPDADIKLNWILHRFVSKDEMLHSMISIAVEEIIW